MVSPFFLKLYSFCPPSSSYLNNLEILLKVKLQVPNFDKKILLGQT